MRCSFLIFLCLACVPSSCPNGANDDKPKTPTTSEERALFALVDAYLARSQSPESFDARTTKETALEALRKYFAAQGGKTDDQWVRTFLDKMRDIHLEEEEKTHAKILTRLKRRSSQ